MFGAVLLGEHGMDHPEGAISFCLHVLQHTALLVQNGAKQIFQLSALLHSWCSLDTSRVGSACQEIPLLCLGDLC